MSKAPNEQRIRKQIADYHQALAIEDSIDFLNQLIFSCEKDHLEEGTCKSCKENKDKKRLEEKLLHQIIRGNQVTILSVPCLGRCGAIVTEGVDGMNGYCTRCLKEQQRQAAGHVFTVQVVLKNVSMSIDSIDAVEKAVFQKMKAAGMIDSPEQCTITVYRNKEKSHSGTG